MLQVGDNTEICTVKRIKNPCRLRVSLYHEYYYVELESYDREKGEWYWRIISNPTRIGGTADKWLRAIRYKKEGWLDLIQPHISCDEKEGVVA